MLNPIFKFLKELRENNNRDWFNTNKDYYLENAEIFKVFIQKLILKIAEFDSSVLMLEPKDCVFRIYRDVRFSKNKAPYKNHFGAYIAKGGRKSDYAGYYIHLEPNATIVGGGIYRPKSEVLKAIRTEIYYNPEEFQQIITDKEFVNNFKRIYGESLKIAPRDFPKDFPYIQLLNHKSYATSRFFKDSEVLSADFMEKLIKLYKSQFVFNSFLNRAIEFGEKG